jgi:hypothetical protein
MIVPMFAPCALLTQEPPTDHVHFCAPRSEHDLNLEGFQLDVPRADTAQGSIAGAPNVVTMLDNGDPANRIDIVFVCDGFTAADLGSWPGAVTNGYERLFDYEPFTRYRSYFNIHRVDVISAESGVDNDPTNGIERDTALDMAFWCSDIERLLCVNTSAAAQQGNYAPDADQIIAVANSSKYGGAGYTYNDIATYSAFNSSSVEVFIHELGHSFGDLADEYDYGGSTTYEGSEFSAINATIMTENEMEGTSLKWDAWLGSDLAGVGTHGCFEGCNYHQYGAYRPSSTSMMKALAQPFNSPSREQIIKKIYETVSIIDDYAPATAAIERDATATVQTTHTTSSLMHKRWYLDGEQITGATGANLDLATVDLGDATTLTVRVWDPTSMVRDEAMRETLMTQEVSWTIEEAPGLPGDVNGDGVVNGVDLSRVLGYWGSANPATDFNNDGTTNGADLAFLLGNWTG